MNKAMCTHTHTEVFPGTVTCLMSHLKLRLSGKRRRDVRRELGGYGDGRHRLTVLSCHYFHLSGCHRNRRTYNARTVALK